jgi:RNA polymerase sigma-70 factor (ECF subfamily)
MNSAEQFDQALEAANGGSASAWGRLLEGQRQVLRHAAANWLNRIYRAKQDQSDVVQNTFVTAYQVRERFTGSTRDDLFRWLLRLLWHKCTGVARRYGRQKRALAREGPYAADALASPSTTIPSKVCRHEDEARLAVALSRLPVEERWLIELRIENNLSYPEISSLLGCSPDAARKRYGRALERLRQELEASTTIQ